MLAPAAGYVSRRSESGDTAMPFLVSGKVHGRHSIASVASPADALAEIARRCLADPAASGCWQLRGDYSNSVTMVVRFREGQLGASRRLAHLVQLHPGVPQGCTVTAECGEPMVITDVEWLRLGAGMPCEACVREICTLPSY